MKDLICVVHLVKSNLERRSSSVWLRALGLLLLRHARRLARELGIVRYVRALAQADRAKEIADVGAVTRERVAFVCRHVLEHLLGTDHVASSLQRLVLAVFQHPHAFLRERRRVSCRRSAAFKRVRLLRVHVSVTLSSASCGLATCWRSLASEVVS